MPRGRDRGRVKRPVFGSQEEGRKVGSGRRKTMVEEERDRGKKKKINILNICSKIVLENKPMKPSMGPKATVYRVLPAFCTLM